MRLICQMWCERDTDLPMDMDKIARIARVGPRQFKNKIWPDIEGYFMALEGGGSRNADSGKRRKTRCGWPQKGESSGNAAAKLSH